MKRVQTAEVDSRDKILDAAEGFFAQRGFAGVGISEIAEAVGLGKSSLFHHFRSKVHLYAAVVARILADIETELTRTLAAGGTAQARLERWIDTLVDVLGGHPTYSRLLLRSLFEDDELGGDLEEEQDAQRTLNRIIDGIGSVLREGMTRGELRAASIPHTVQSLIGMVIYHFASGDFGTELVARPLFAPTEVRRRKDEIRALLRHGLVAPPARGKE